MYSLRKVLKSGTEVNEFIGAKYSLVNKDFDPIEFDRLWDGDPDVYAYVNDMPLYRDDRNYIISSNGALYCNVSYKRRQVEGDSNVTCSGTIVGKLLVGDDTLKTVAGNTSKGNDITI